MRSIEAWMQERMIWPVRSSRSEASIRYARAAQKFCSRRQWIRRRRRKEDLDCWKSELSEELKRTSGKDVFLRRTGGCQSRLPHCLEQSRSQTVLCVS